MRKKEIIEKINIALEQIRPFLNDDGGDIDISSVLNLKQVEIQGQMMPIAIYKYSQKKIVETQNGFSIEMNKKKKQDVMVNISID